MFAASVDLLHTLPSQSLPHTHRELGRQGSNSRTTRRRDLHPLGAFVFAPVFVVTALAIGALATRLLPGGLTSLAWSALLAGDVGYACLAVGFAGALVLFQTRRPWVAVRALTVGLFVNLASGYVLSHLFGSFYAVLGLCLGAADNVRLALGIHP